MNTRERHRRDGAILAASRAGIPARKIAAEFGLSKRTCNRVRVLHKQPIRPRAIEKRRPAVIREGSEDPRSGCCHPQGVSVELQKVVSGGDQAPFRACCRPASSFEAPDPSVRLYLREDRLGHAPSL